MSGGGFVCDRGFDRNLVVLARFGVILRKAVATASAAFVIRIRQRFSKWVLENIYRV